MSFFLGNNNFIGRRHPATRILLLLASFAPPMIVSTPIPMGAILFCYLLGAIFTGAWKNLWRVKWFVILFVFMSVCLWSVFYQADDKAYFAWGPISPSPNSALYGLAMGLRLVSFLVSALIFLSSTRIEEMNHGLLSLGLPYRGAFALSLAFRLMPLFTESAQQIATAQRVRGLDVSRGNIFKRTKHYVAILAPVLIAALRRANGLAIALETKGFGLRSKRTSIVQYKFGFIDILWLVIMCGFITATVLFVHFHDDFQRIMF